MILDPRVYAQLHELFKYPRTPHLESSRLQEGDSDHDQVKLCTLKDQFIVVEEKLDGANAAISFSSRAELLLQSRGHYLIGGSREKQFNLFKQWARVHELFLLERLEDRYVMFGEVMSKKHSVFYDRLPGVFFEFDIWDRRRQLFLSTAERRRLLLGGPVLSVPVLYEGIAPVRLNDLLALVGKSWARTDQWKERFEHTVRREGLDVSKAWSQCDDSDLMEGLYIKVETASETVARMKWVRPDFVQTILDANEHHLRQPYVPNELAPGVDLYAPVPAVTLESLNRQ